MKIYPSNCTIGNESQPDIQCAADAVLPDREEHTQSTRKANRCHAHLNRKRKSDITVEDIVNEQPELRRQVKILESIPDLIVAFESSGRVFFASHSLLDFLGLSKANEIEDTLFWERLTPQSAGVIREEVTAALKHATEAEEEECTPIAEGRSVQVDLVVKDGQGRLITILVSLKGMVHTNEGVSDCVCSIRLIADTAEVKHVCSAVSSLSSASDDGTYSQKKIGETFKRVKVDYDCVQVSDLESTK